MLPRFLGLMRRALADLLAPPRHQLHEVLPDPDPDPSEDDMAPTVEIEPMDRSSRKSYTRWVATEAIDQLAAQLGSPIWRDDLSGRLIRLEGRDKEVLKAEVVARVKAQGGRIELKSLVLTTVGDGLKVTVNFPVARR